MTMPIFVQEIILILYVTVFAADAEGCIPEATVMLKESLRSDDFLAEYCRLGNGIP